VINAPQVANSTGVHDKVVSIAADRKTVRLQLTDGFARKNAVRYLSTDASAEAPAALEGSTFAPRLAQAPRPGDDSTDSGRAGLVAFVNGPTGPTQRQGINSALLGQGDPLNVLAWLPNQGRYSPLWDVHLTAWAAGRTPRVITEFAAVEDLADDRSVSTDRRGDPTTSWSIAPSSPDSGNARRRGGRTDGFGPLCSAIAPCTQRLLRHRYGCRRALTTMPAWPVCPDRCQAFDAPAARPLCSRIQVRENLVVSSRNVAMVSGDSDGTVVLIAASKSACVITGSWLLDRAR
jgi:hypothetical protein